MLVLFETPAGFALFRVLDEGKLELSPDELHSKFSSLDRAKEIVSLKEFYKFSNMTEALAATSALLEGNIDKSLEFFLENSVVKKGIQQRLAVCDKTLGKAINEKFNLDVVSNNNIMELFRCIRSQLEGLLSNNMAAEDLGQMTLGLSHSLGRYKLKFSPDKVDVMIVQAIGLMDDLDKEINNYAMRVKEWYGWHFPELARLVTDNLLYARVVKHLRQRNRIKTVDLSDVLDEETEKIVAKAAGLSMGTDVTDEDIEHLVELSDQVIELYNYRDELGEYIKNRMFAIAPNLTVLVGELVGARLIAHSGSLLNLAKHASSTVQILGAEKALFRALKAKAATPKYGVIFNASIVGQATAKNKGKISRILANKASLGCRVDALGDETTKQIGLESLAKISATMVTLEGKALIAPTSANKPQTLYERPQRTQIIEEEKNLYDGANDVTLGVVEEMETETNGKKDRKDKKEKKDKKDKKDKKRKRDDKDASSSKKLKGEK